MTARVKLAEANFFLDRLRTASIMTIDFRHYSSACAGALYGAVQHLLYDYAIRYWQFDEDEYLDSNVFRHLAKERNDPNAADFIRWYDGLRARIQGNDDASIIWRLRRTETHRVSAPYQFRFESFGDLNLSGSSNISGHMEYSVVRPSGDVIPSGTRIPTRSLVDEVPNSSVTAYFPENPSKSIVDVFESTIDFVDSLICEAEDSFNLS